MPGHRIKAGQRLIQDEQPRALSQRNRQGELRALTAGQRAHFPVERDAQLGDASESPVVVPADVEVRGQAEHAACWQMAIQRRVLSDETDADPGVG